MSIMSKNLSDKISIVSHRRFSKYLEEIREYLFYFYEIKCENLNKTQIRKLKLYEVKAIEHLLNLKSLLDDIACRDLLEYSDNEVVSIYYGKKDEIRINDNSNN